MRLAIIASFILLAMCGILYIVYSPAFQFKALFHIIVAMPILAGIGIFAFSDKFKDYQQITLVIFVSILFIDIIWIAFDLKQPYEDLFYGGIAIIELFLLMLMRIQCRFLVPVTVFLFVIYNLILSQDRSSLGFIYFMYNYFFIAAAGLGILNNYNFERTFRRDYLQQELLQQESLNAEKQQIEQRESIKYDILTGLINYNYFHEQLEQEWRRALRHQYPLALLIIDVDYFGKFREFYGESAGDVLLQRIAAICKYIGRRPGDMAARYSADEFVLLFQGTDEAGAKMLANKIIEQVAQQAIAHQASKISQHVTLSIGGSAMMPNRNTTCDEMMRQADKALYEAKKAGFNKVVIY